MIKAIIFDCFGVLYRDNISLLYDVVPEDKWQDLRDIIHATDHGFLSRDEYYQNIADLGKLTVEEVRAVEARQHQRDQTMIDYTQTLRPKCKVGLLSNIDVDTMDKLFPVSGRSEMFDIFVISGEVGVTKPSPRIFEIAAERLDLQPDECVMVDDIPENIEGARMAGMHGIVFTSKPNLERDLAKLLG